MDFDGWTRERTVASCAFSYPFVWLGAGVGGYIAAVTSGVETGTRGLGHFLVGFAVGVAGLSVLWAVFAFAATARLGRWGRCLLAAIVPPVLVVVCAFQSVTLAVGCGLFVPVVACWWATEPS